jgi:hypothetical protein
MRKRDKYLNLMEPGVNIPRLIKEQMRNIRTGLDDLFRYEINPLMTGFQPDPGDGMDSAHSRAHTKNRYTRSGYISCRH